MSDNWSVYLTYVEEDTVASILLDMGIASQGADPNRPWLLRIAIILKSPHENGLISAEEHDAVMPIEQKLIDSIVSQYDAVHVGTMTFQGRRDNSFYAANSDGFDQFVQSLAEAFPEYSIRSDATENADWSYYFELLYPNPYEEQSMNNRWVLSNLQKSGDSLEKERPVSHWIYFANEKSRAAFVSEVQKQGFQIKEENQSDDASDLNPYGAQIERIDHVHQAAIDEVTINLRELANSFEGTYDGWETFVVTEEE